MPTRVQLPDGNIGEFPDGMSNEQIEAVLQKQYPKPGSSPANVLKTQDRTAANYGSEIARGVGRGLLNDLQGLVMPEVQAAHNLRHPIQSAKEFADQAQASADAIKKSYRESAAGTPGERTAATALGILEQAPMVGGLVQRAEQGGTQMASPEGAGAAAEGITTVAAPEIVPKAVGGILRKSGDATRAVTGTGTKPVRELVEKTAQENKAATEKAADKNADQAAKRQVDLRKHFDKTQDVKAENTSKEAQVSRKQALNRGVEHLDTQFKTDLTKLRDDEHTGADGEYQALSSALDDKTAEPAFLPDALLKATDKIKGSNTEPAILKDMEKRLASGDELTYRDLQGYYSEIGRELTKGTLVGDVYAAFDTLQDAIGEEMQRIADENGKGPQLQHARNRWRQMKQTFYDPKSPVTKAIKSTERGSAVKAFQGKDQSGVEALAKYSPELARRANTIRGYQSEAASLPKKATGLKSLPKLAEKPADVTPETKTIGPEDIANAKAESLDKRKGRLSTLAYGSAVWPLFQAIRDVTSLQPPGPRIIPEISGSAALGYGITRLLENPKVVDYLTKATPKDVAAIPPDLRGDLGGIIQAAQQKGLKVSPALLNAAKRTGVAAALSGNKPKFDVETGTSGTPTGVQPSNELMPGGGGDLSSLPGFLQRTLEGAKIVQGAPTATYGKPDIATVDDSPNTITVRDPSRMQPQVLAHEAKHIFDRNLAPEVRAQFPKDDPQNPYFKPEELYGLPDMRKRGMTAKNLPEEKQAQLAQAQVQYANDPEMQQILKPWMDDMEKMRQSNIMPTDPDQAGINTTPRPPAAPDYGFQTGGGVAKALNPYANPEARPPDESFKFNQPWAKSGTYVTKLSPQDEAKFQAWVKQNRVPWKDTPTADYDMRGYWKALQQGKIKANKTPSGFDGAIHFTDEFKTPYSGVFSRESMYATPNAPHWQGDVLVTADGQVVADETPKPRRKVGQLLKGR